MQQTPINDIVNLDILNMMSSNYKKVIEVGCSSGALAKAYLNSNPNCHYTGIEISEEYANVARPFCTEVLTGNIEEFSDESFEKLFPSDCWIFADVLEHLYNPWKLLSQIRQNIDMNGHIIACVPNAQHWSIQARLNCGKFYYEDSGLMDRTHIRWFTRTTLIQMFQSSGFRIIEGAPRILDEPHRDRFLPAIRELAKANQIDPEIATNDSIAFQWVVKASPA